MTTNENNVEAAKVEVLALGASVGWRDSIGSSITVGAAKASNIASAAEHLVALGPGQWECNAKQEGAVLVVHCSAPSTEGRVQLEYAREALESGESPVADVVQECRHAMGAALVRSTGGSIVTSPDVLELWARTYHTRGLLSMGSRLPEADERRSGVMCVLELSRAVDISLTEIP